jgi:uncharacterized protein with von Willebrand factor type A (vWA) domain
MLLYRYSRWDGTQDVFTPDEDQALEELADDLMEHGDIRRALRDLYQRGIQRPDGDRLMGLRDLLDRLRNRRQEMLQRHNMDSLMDDLKQRLAEVVETERRGIDRRVEEARERLTQDGERPELRQLLERLEEQARQSRETLDDLPDSPGGAIRRFSDYEFMDPEAARKFQELLDMLKGRMLENFSQNLRQALEGMGPQEMAQLREMLHALTQMVREQQQGGQPDFQGFMERFGQFFGPNPPQSLEELLDQMAQQMAGMQSLMDSLSPEQRGELEELLESAVDPATAQEMAELARTLADLLPPQELRPPYQFQGDESVTLDHGMELMAQLHSMDDLEAQIQEVTRWGEIDALDPAAVEELLGRDASRSLEELQRIARMLEEAGYLQRRGSRLELTPRGIRKVAQQALKEIYLKLKKEHLGRHDLFRRGQGGEHTGEHRPYQFGDTFDVDLERTLVNGIRRGGAGTPVRLRVEDFEIRETEHLTQTATCLLLDQSRSMGLFRSFQGAKRVCMALEALIHGQYARDTLYIIGFSDYAVEIRPEDLPQLSWNSWVSGTNMHHALMLSRSLLARHKNATRQVLMITDGEPTAHLEGDYSAFSYPPSYRTIQETLKEVKRCTQEGITINTFMLDSSPDLQGFVDRLTRINGGRAFYTTPDHLGEYVLADYTTHRRKRVSG